MESPRGVHSRAQAVALALQQEIRDADQLIVSGLDARRYGRGLGEALGAGVAFGWVSCFAAASPTCV